MQDRIAMGLEPGQLAETPQALEPHFVHDIDTVEYCAEMFRAHKILPNAGGRLDQDAGLMRDIMAYLALRAAIWQERDAEYTHQQHVGAWGNVPTLSDLMRR